jgi:hypothetical protein
MVLGCAAGAVRGLPQRPRQGDGQRTQHRHGPKPLRPDAGVEHAGEQGQAGTGGPNADRAIERLRRAWKGRRHDPGKQPHAGEMEQRKRG